MIAATSAAPQPTPVSGNSAGAPGSIEGDAGPARGDAAKQVSPKEGGRGASATRDARAAEARARDGEAATDEGPEAPAFAELLAASGAGTPGTATPREPATELDAHAADLPDLADRLLSLLTGTWAAVAEPAPAAAAAALPAEPGATAGRATTASLPGLAALTVAPAATAADAGAAGAKPEAAGTEAGVAALAKLAGDAAVASGDAMAATPAADAPQPGAPLATLGPVANNARPVAAVPGTPMPMPANPEAGFDDGFGARIAWMAEQRLGHAEIRLNPEHIGPIEVRVQLDGTRVSAEFHSAHAEVRQAIEASVPRLREMLGQQGLQLGHADVGQRQAQGHGQPADGRPGRGGEPGAERHPGDGTAGVVTATVRSRGLLDEYA